jgi:putative drug exporter of the RND superfamily
MLKLTRWMIAHRWIVVGVWIVIAIGLIGVSQVVGTRSASDFSLPNTDSQRAVDLLRSRFPVEAGDTDQIVFHALTGKLTDTSARAAIVPLLDRIAHLPRVAGVVSPYEPGANAISTTGTIGFATIEFDQSAVKLPATAINSVIMAAQSADSPLMQVELGGQAINQVQVGGLGFVTIVGLAAAVVVLLLTFGSLLAMGLPLATALLGLGAGLGAIGLLSHLLNMVGFASELALMLGLGVGIDYALFVVTRFRDAYRENGGDVEAAIELAMNTAGRAVLFAGGTVIIAMLSLCALGVSMLYGAAIAASLSVLFVLRRLANSAARAPQVHRPAYRPPTPPPIALRPDACK